MSHIYALSLMKIIVTLRTVKTGTYFVRNLSTLHNYYYYYYYYYYYSGHDGRVLDWPRILTKEVS